MCLQKGNTAAEGDSAFLINTPAYQDLKARVKKAIPYQFATWEWYVKATVLFALTVYVEWTVIESGPSVLKGLVLGKNLSSADVRGMRCPAMTWRVVLSGCLMAFIGLAIQHDANHGAVHTTIDPCALRAMPATDMAFPPRFRLTDGSTRSGGTRK